MARTIDNLGVDTSNRYAEDREVYDDTLIKEARLIPSQTRVTTTTPSYGSEFDLLFELDQKGALWAAFMPPPKYSISKRPLFGWQLIPDLGSPDLQEAKLDKLETLCAEEKEKSPQESEEIDKEKNILTKLLSNLHIFDQLLIDINSRRSQYQKG